MNNPHTRLAPVLAGLLLGIFMSAMDNTIVASAMGKIVAHLGGLDEFVWVTSAYMVTEMAGMPIFGKLSDMYGRKRFFILGLLLFVAGSMLCGTAATIPELAVYRAVQGIGAGSLVPIAFTIIFDVVPPEKVGRLSGMFGTVFGLASIIGPLLGSFITEHIDWRWVFYINVPIGIATLLLIIPFYRESRRHERRSIDWLGAVALIPAIVCLMFALELGGRRFAWDSFAILGLFGASAVLFVLFFYAETKAKDPILSYAMFRFRLFAGSNLLAIFTGMAYIPALIYIPIYVQGVFGGSAIMASLVLLPMMLGTAVSAGISGHIINRYAYRTLMLISCSLLAAGIFLLSSLTASTPRFLLMLYMIFIGIGLGPSFSVLSMAAMHHFDESRRGSANATLSFVRQLSMAVGIVVFGIVQRNAFIHNLSFDRSNSNFMNAEWLTDPHAMLSPETRVQIPADALGRLTVSLSDSVALMFMWAVIPALLAVGFVFWLGPEKWSGFQQPANHADTQTG